MELPISAGHPLHPEQDRLVRLARSLGLDATSLDEAVHDCAAAGVLDDVNATDAEVAQEEILDVAGDCAAEINNGGLDRQIEYLLLHNDVATVERLLREAGSAPGGA